MENLFSNVTRNSNQSDVCHFGPAYIMVLSLIDIITFLMGQPLITRLLWITFTSKKTIDILNFNLALFHNFQYLTSTFHLAAMFLLPNAQQQILKFLLVYAQVGGPMSLSFISIERYVAVIHPMSYSLLKKYRCREVFAVTMWLLTVPIALASLLAKTLASFLNQQVLQIIQFSALCIMIAIMLRCSIRIAMVLKKSGPGLEKMHPAKKKAFHTLRATSAIALFCYTPVNLLQRLMSGNEYIYDCIVTPGCIFLLSVGSIVHPLFYLLTQGKLFTCFK